MTGRYLQNPLLPDFDAKVISQPQYEAVIKNIQSALPRELELRTPIFYNDNSSPFDLWNRKVCGGATFLLSEEKAQEIITRGSAYLNESGTTHWVETLLDSSLNEEGFYTIGFQCMQPDADLISAVKQSAQAKGSYFAHWNTGELLVLPQRRLVIVTFPWEVPKPK